MDALCGNAQPIVAGDRAEMNSGKTTLLRLVRFLVPRPLFIVEIVRQYCIAPSKMLDADADRR